jgi:hypothetical protein
MIDLETLGSAAEGTGSLAPNSGPFQFVCSEAGQSSSSCSSSAAAMLQERSQRQDGECPAVALPERLTIDRPMQLSPSAGKSSPVRGQRGHLQPVRRFHICRQHFTLRSTGDEANREQWEWRHSVLWGLGTSTVAFWEGSQVLLVRVATIVRVINN